MELSRGRQCLRLFRALPFRPGAVRRQLHPATTPFRGSMPKPESRAEDFFGCSSGQPSGCECVNAPALGTPPRDGHHLERRSDRCRMPSTPILATKRLTAVTALARCQTGETNGPTRRNKMICLFRHAARHISQVHSQDIGNASEEACINATGPVGTAKWACTMSGRQRRASLTAVQTFVKT